MQDTSSGGLSTEATIARVLLFAGAALAGFMALIFLGFLVAFMSTSERGLGTPPLAVLPFGVFLLFGVSAIAGVIVNLVAAGRISDKPRQAGILGVVAAFLPPTNLFSLAGAILALLSPEAKRENAA